MIIDGHAIAEGVYRTLEKRRAALARAPRLGIIVCSADPVTESFVRIKRRAAERLGVEIERIDLGGEARTEDAITAVHALASRVDGVIVQLPLPKSIDTNAVLSEVPRERDIDAVNPVSEGHTLVEAPVACAITEILSYARVSAADKHAVVIGAGRLVGAPAAALLKRLGAHVCKFTETEGSLEDLKNADIVVSGVGNPGLVRPEHLKDGVVLVDAGTSEQGGKVHGDAAPACADKAGVFTPVPGGVGPVAVAMIFRNLFDLIEKR